MIDAPLAQLAETYARDARLASTSGVSAEPEAQLTVPVSEFLRAFSSVTGLGDLSLLREAQLDGVRPDFAALIDGRPCGWVELKAPGHTVIGEKWRGREKGQWDLLSQLDALLVSNGDEIALYVSGSLVDTAFLPVDGVAGWDADRLRTVLEQFTLAQPRPITRVSQLADRLAPLARFLRERLQEGLSNNYRSVREAKAAWDHTVHHTTTDAQFAGDVAQVVAYSMAIAGLSGQADRNADGVVTLEEAKHALETAHRNVLAASLGPIIGIPALMEYIAPEVGAIMRLVSSMDVAAIERSTDSRGEPWLWFYEDFLQRYDPAARNRAGVYYTPISVVQCQVRVVDALLRERFGQTLGFGAPSVVTLDPATGSGTYPLAVIDRAEAAAREERGPAGVAQVAKNLTKNLLAFELLPGPYSVAHLRIGQRLGADLDPDELDQFGIGMDHALDTMRDGRRIGGEEAGVEAADTAGRGDRARDQEQAGRIGQQSCIGEWRPGAVELCLLLDLAAEAESGLFAGFADRRIGKRTRAAGRDLRAALQEIGFELRRDRGGDRHAVVGLVDAAAGENELAGHEHHLVVALADEHLRLGTGAIDQDQRRGILRPEIRVMIGFLFALVDDGGGCGSFSHFIPFISSYRPV